MTASEPPQTPVQTAQKTLRIVETLKERNGATATEIADALDLPKSSAHNYLRTLEHEGYVVKEDRQYRVGLRFLDLGAHARTREQLYTVAKPELKTLAEETGEHANLLVEEHGLGVFLLREVGENAVGVNSHVGQCVSLHTTALGKSILAQLSEDRRDAIIERHGLDAKTEQTITDQETLEAELADIRESGVAYDREEGVRGLKCVAVPILSGGDIKGAVSVSGPTSRMDDQRIEEELVPQLRDAVNVIELNLAYS